MRLYYWRRGRAHNATTLHIVFTNRDDSDGISGYIKLLEDGTWFYHMKKPFSIIEATEATQEEAQAKVEELIDYEFQPEYMPYFG